LGLPARRGAPGGERQHITGQLFFFPVLPAAPRDIELHSVLLHGLSDRSRLRILEALRGDERRVTEIVTETEMGQPNVSKHLACLWGCGLVAREKRGREVFYWLIPGVEELLSAVDQVLESAGETVGACPLTEQTLELACESDNGRPRR